jgi:hypothetical protein
MLWATLDGHHHPGVAGVKLTDGRDGPGGVRSASAGGRMFPNDCPPPRMYRGDRFCRYRAESLRDSLRADVVGRDQRDKPFDRSTLVRPFPDGRGCFGRISMAPVGPYQGPSKLGLTMTSCVSPGRGRPAARIENHETGLADHLPVGGRGLNNEGTEPVPSPSADPLLDDGSRFLGYRDRLLAQAMHDVGVREQVVKRVRVRRSRRA